MSSTVIKRPRDTNDDDASGGGPAAAKRQNNKLRIKLVGRRAGSDRDEKKMLTIGGGLLVGDLRSQVAEKFKVSVEALGLLHADGHAPQGFAIDDDEVVEDVHTDAPFFIRIAVPATAAAPQSLTGGDKVQRTAAGDGANAMELDGNGEAAPSPTSATRKPVAADPPEPDSKPTGPPDAIVRLFCRHRPGEAGEPVATWLQAAVPDLITQARKTLKIPADLLVSLSTATSSLDGRAQATLEACGVHDGDAVYATVYAPGDAFASSDLASMQRKHLEEALQSRGVELNGECSTLLGLRELLTQELKRAPPRLEPTSRSLWGAVEAWQPSDCRQTPAALATYLSTLKMVHSEFGPPARTKELVNKFASLIPYPPAIRALFSFMEARHADQFEAHERAALSAAFLDLSNMLMPPGTFVEDLSNDSRLGQIATLLVCVLSAPAPPEVVNARVFLRSPATKDAADVVLLHPRFHADVTTVTMTRTAIGGTSTATGFLGSLAKAFPTKVALLRKNTAFRFLDVVPPLSLMRSRFPSLTRGKDGNMCVNLGPPACSSGVTSLYSPMSGTTTTESPDVLAKVLSDSGISNVVDDRPTKEILVIALDRSGSMNSNFEDDDAPPPAPVVRTISITAHDAHTALLRLRDSSWGPIVQQRLYGKYHPSPDETKQVFNIIAKLHYPMDDWYRAMLSQHNELCMNILRPYIVKEELRVPVPAGGDAFRIRLEGSCGAMELAVTANMTIWELKRLVIEKMPQWAVTSSLQLKSAGRVVEDHQSLVELHIHDKSVVDVRKQAVHGIPASLVTPAVANRAVAESQPMSITFKGGAPKYRFTLLCPRTETVSGLLQRLYRDRDLDPTKLSLWYDLKDCGDGHLSGHRLYDFRQPESFGSIVGACIATPHANELALDIMSPSADPKLLQRSLSRMDCTKQIFHALLNRISAYQQPVQVGLVTFGDDVRVACPITPLFEQFRSVVDRVTAGGDTKCHEALETAIDLLHEKAEEVKAATPAAPAPLLRILVLSDGKDTKSTAICTPLKILSKLHASGIVLDAMIIGDGSEGLDLKALAFSSAAKVSGHAVHPHSIEDALRFMEHEGFVSANQRPVLDNVKNKSLGDKARRRLLNQNRFVEYNSYDGKALQSRRKPDEMVRAARTLKTAIDQMSLTSGGMAEKSKRVLAELKNIMKLQQQGQFNHIDVYPSEANINFWKIVIEAPSTPGVAAADDMDCMYSGAVFAAYIIFPSDFPQRAPEMRFVTPIRHVNVNSHGRICHGILGRDWDSRISVKEVLDCIYGLLLVPDIDDALDSHLAFRARQDDNTAYIDEVKHLARDPRCTKGREEWKQIMLMGE